ncbi:MAG TPA: hypothetical protein VF721_09755 [Pyrinomonadaceae bacterium]
MIRVLMLDLGDTLIDKNNQPFPHVPEALEIIRSFETEAHKPLSLCLVSDFHMPTSGKTVQKIFQEYVKILEKANLRQFFEPVEKHVTLSTHAGVRKPERRIFELAVQRLGVKAKLDECLFITENAEHIKKSRLLGIKTLMFSETEGEGDFSDWSEAPLLIAQAVNPASTKNLENALRLPMAVGHDLELLSVSEKSGEDIIRGQVNKSHSLPGSESESGHKAIVTIPVNVEIKMSKKGKIKAVKTEEPEKEHLDEAAHYIKTLEDNKQVKHGEGPLGPGETHRETVNEKGEKRIERKRFSII